MREFGVGQSLARVEDDRLLRGDGRYTDDIHLAGELHMYVVRSPHAAATITAIDKRAALDAPGVCAVLTAADLRGAAIEPIGSKVPHKRHDGAAHLTTPYMPLADGRVAYVGDAVAVVVAQSLSQARDAAELLVVDYEPHEAVVDAQQALQSGAATVWPDHPDNACFEFKVGDPRACADAFARAAHVVKERFVITRVATNSLEPRAAIGEYDPREGRYVLHAGLQMPHETGRDIAQCLGIPVGDLRVISPDVGGGFGMKLPVYQEYLLVLIASRLLARAVRWISDRGEAFVSDQQARDNVSDVELALDASGRFLALRVRTLANLGAYVGQWSLHVPTGNLGGLAGPYKIGAFDVSVTGVLTNTVPVGAYRGAGRPEASYCIERIVESAARELRLDPLELRLRNMIDAAEMPYATGLVFTYDCGDFKAVAERAAQASGWSDYAVRRAASQARGLLRGRGMAYVIESAGGPAGIAFDEHVEIRFDSTGGATLLVGSHSHGQGHETTYRQLAAEFLGLAPADVRVVCGDTDRVRHGRGSFGSRTMMAGGAAFKVAAAKIVEQGRRIAAHALEASADDVRFDNGRFEIVGTDRAISLRDVARMSFVPWSLSADIETGLHAAGSSSAGGISFPNGCHVCEVEIDPQTGEVRILSYLVVEDVGTVVNPLLLKGQVQGGVVQGLGQALMEQIVYDAQSGQLLTGSFMDYAMPKADVLPGIEVISHPVPTSANPLGVKGAGEAGTVGALAAAMNAIGDALWAGGVAHFDMPATPCRVWEALASARRGLSAADRVAG